MAADCLKANSMQQIPIITGEEDINSSEVELDKPKVEELRASKRFHRFYFVKFWPYKDPYEASKISEAEKLIEKIDQELIQINEQCKLLRVCTEIYPQFSFIISFFLITN